MDAYFPNFQPLALEHKPSLEQITAAYHPYSDFNFASLWSYNVEDDTLISDLNGNLVIRFRDYITNEFFFSLLGTTDVIESVHKVMAYAQSAGITTSLKLIPQTTIDSTPALKDVFLVTEDLDNHDYIVSADEISALVGEKHHKKAALSRQFSRMYPDHEVKVLDLNQPETHSHIMELFYTWEQAKGKLRKDTQHELTALQRLLQTSNSFNILPMGIYHNNQLVSLALTEIVHENYAIIHFMKTNPAYKGISEATHQYNSQNLALKGVKFINMEQDMGLPGLRNAKSQWHPVHFLKKYIISQK